MENRKTILKKLGYPLATRGSVDMLVRSHPSVLIEYLANRLGDKEKILCVVGCGVGVSLKVFAPYFKSLIGLDNDVRTLAACQSNLEVSNYWDTTDLILGDATDHEIIDRVIADIIVFDIPRPEGVTKAEGDKIIVTTLFNIYNNVTREIAGFASPQYTYKEIKGFIGDIPIEFQKVYLKGKHYKTIIYSGDLIEKEGVTTLKL